MFVHAIVYTFMRLLIRWQMLPTKATESGFHEQWWFLSIFVIYKISSRKTTTTTKNKKGKNKTYLKFQQNTLKNWFHILRNKFLVICMNFDTYLWFSPISIYFLVVFFSVSLFLIVSRVFWFLNVIVCFSPQIQKRPCPFECEKNVGDTYLHVK